MHKYYQDNVLIGFDNKQNDFIYLTNPQENMSFLVDQMEKEGCFAYYELQLDRLFAYVDMRGIAVISPYALGKILHRLIHDNKKNKKLVLCLVVSSNDLLEQIDLWCHKKGERVWIVSSTTQFLCGKYSGYTADVLVPITRNISISSSDIHKELDSRIGSGTVSTYLNRLYNSKCIYRQARECDKTGRKGFTYLVPSYGSFLESLANSEDDN